MIRLASLPSLADDSDHRGNEPRCHRKKKKDKEQWFLIRFSDKLESHVIWLFRVQMTL